MRGESAEHLRRVLRAAAGQTYELSDGASVRLGKIERVARDAVEFSLDETVPSREPRLRVTVGLSIVKFERFEWAIEKATELGVAEVVPLAAGRSESKLISAAPKRSERWRKILVEAAQQSRRLRPPAMRETMRVDQFVNETRDGGCANAARVWFSEEPTAKPLRSALLQQMREKVTAACVAIGPEGGWTEEENAAAMRSGFVAVSLGLQILRTETAVVAALASLNYALGD